MPYSLKLVTIDKSTLKIRIKVWFTFSILEHKIYLKKFDNFFKVKSSAFRVLVASGVLKATCGWFTENQQAFFPTLFLKGEPMWNIVPKVQMP